MWLSTDKTQPTEFALIPYSTSGGKGYVVQRTKDKQRLSSWSGSISRGLHAFDVAGTSYRRKALQDPAFSPGRRLAILPDPANPVDPEALGVWDIDRRLHIGYVPKDYSPSIKRQMLEEVGYTYLSMWERQVGRMRVGLRVLAIGPDVKITLPNKPPRDSHEERRGHITKEVSCPKCGSGMVVRTAKRGPNAGQRYHVCTRYPDCQGRTLASK